jgi:DNA repair exonuclease SbcCD ATPase subunit
MINEIDIEINEVQTELTKTRDQATTYQADSPGRMEVMERIAGLEGRLARLHESDKQIAALLASHSVKTIQDLDELRKEHENTIIATGNKVWQELLFVRGLGKYGAGDRTRWLPSDLVKVEGFPELEKTARSQIEKAKAALPKVIEDLAAINALWQRRCDYARQ